MLGLVASCYTVHLFLYFWITSHSILLLCGFCLQDQDWLFALGASVVIHHLTFAPPTLLQLSNQPILICYNRGPSGPYYSNPCDVIPKQHCFLCSKRRTILNLTTDRISSVLLDFTSPPSPLRPTAATQLRAAAAQRQTAESHTDFAVWSLHQQQVCGQSRCSYQHKQYTVLLDSGKGFEWTVCVCAFLSI